MGSERELIALVRRPEAEGLVEAMRVGAAIVAGQLDEAAAAPAAFLDRPFEHLPPDAGAALGGCNPHALDLAAPHPAPSQTRDVTELEDADHLAAAVDDHEQLVRIALDCIERLGVAQVQAGPDSFALAPDRII